MKRYYEYQFLYQGNRIVNGWTPSKVSNYSRYTPPYDNDIQMRVGLTEQKRCKYDWRAKKENLVRP